MGHPALSALSFQNVSLCSLVSIASYPHSCRYKYNDADAYIIIFTYHIHHPRSTHCIDHSFITSAQYPASTTPYLSSVPSTPSTQDASSSLSSASPRPLHLIPRADRHRRPNLTQLEAGPRSEQCLILLPSSPFYTQPRLNPRHR